MRINDNRINNSSDAQVGVARKTHGPRTLRLDLNRRFLRSFVQYVRSSADRLRLINDAHYYLL